ncbi:MAG: hypothetical protein ACXWLH_04115 [Candidatus Saccharimonadales bacterium]
MSIKRGLVGFGMATALATGGFYSIHEALDANSKKDETSACIGKSATRACDSLVATQESVNSLETETQIYALIGGLSMIGAAYMSLTSFGEVMSDDEEKSASANTQPVTQTA